IIVPDAPALNFSSNQDFSIEAWIQPLTSPANFQDVMVIVEKRIAPDTITQLGYQLALGNGVLNLQMADVLAPYSWHNFTTPGPDLRDGKFHHVAVSVQRNSTNGGQIFIDGNVVLTFDPTVCPGDLSNTGPFRIGNVAVPGLAANYDGIIDEVSLYNRALTATEVQAIYNAGSQGKCVEITPPPPVTNCVPPPAGLVGWWKGEDNGNDSAGTNNATVSAGVAYASAEVGQGFSLSGQADQIIVPDAPALNFSSNQDFSIEAWIQPLASPANFQDVMVIVEKRIAPDTITQLGYQLALGSGVLGLQMADVLAPYSWHNFSAGPDLRDGKFHHVAVSVQRNSTSGGQFFIDGNLVSTFDPTVCPGDLSNTGPFRIGNVAVPGLAANYDGIIDEVSLYNRALTATEVQSIYNAGSQGKCPPQPPVADATATIPLVISLNNSNATAVLDGSLSSDPEGDPLQYYWFVNNAATASATGVVAVVVLPVGTNLITLSVSDGHASNQQTITVEVITLAQAVERLLDLVNTDVAQAQALAATLSAAIQSIDRGNPTAAINQLLAFQNKVTAQIAPLNPTLAGTLVDQAQTIIDILASGGAKVHGKISATLNRANGRLHLNFSAPLGQIYIIEASTNLLDWQMIGVAKDQGDGTCGFDDPNSMRMSVRFYRIVAP
ncbi:MAG TPA: LamG-like jellyroll fold domain-containing protein, partial [Candidatus Angelobacter sp.]|nr:LamG-like jellyroll fold domain-containing protein [Candidatus Angelobacter sp.]